LLSRTFREGRCELRVAGMAATEQLSENICC
jgi:hypothetical protein